MKLFATRPHSLPSLRLWLQSTVLLAVLAGYSCLFAISTSLAEAERFDRHQRLVANLVQSLERGEIGLPLPASLGFQATWAKTSLRDTSAPFVVRQLDGKTWIESHSWQLSSNERDQRLLVRQDITSDLSRQHRDQQLMVAAAGASALLTAVLLRLVLWRGLLLPLSLLSKELNQVRAQSLGCRSVAHHRQPDELRPIVDAFNNLQHRLAQSWQRERTFVDSVAHELRTPITVISSHAQRLQAVPSQASPAAVAMIAAEAQRLGELISVMLDFARVDAGRLALSLDDLEPETLLLEAFERLQDVAPDRLQLAPSVEYDLPRIRVEADRLHQCLAALVDNALRYSEGPVQLAVSASPNDVTLHVRDQGPGIPVAERDQVLERFARGSTATGTQGSGLGLAIVHDLMRAMQGELVIAEAPGGGADMQLRFMISAPPPAP